MVESWLGHLKRKFMQMNSTALSNPPPAFPMCRTFYTSIFFHLAHQKNYDLKPDHCTVAPPRDQMHDHLPRHGPVSSKIHPVRFHDNISSHPSTKSCQKGHKGVPPDPTWWWILMFLKQNSLQLLGKENAMDFSLVPHVPQQGAGAIPGCCKRLLRPGCWRNDKMRQPFMVRFRIKNGDFS